MSADEFHRCFGVGPAEIGTVDFRGLGIPLETAQLAAVAAITIIYNGGTERPTPTTVNSLPSHPASDTQAPTEPGEAVAVRPASPPGAVSAQPAVVPPERTGAAEPTVGTPSATHVDDAPDVPPRAMARRVVLGARSPSIVITFGSGRQDEPIVIDDDIGIRAGAPPQPVVVDDSDDDADDARTNERHGRNCWRVADGNDVEPGCNSPNCHCRGPASMGNGTQSRPADEVANRETPRPHRAEEAIVTDDDTTTRVASVQTDPWVIADSDDEDDGDCDLSCYLPSSPSYDPIDYDDSTGPDDAEQISYLPSSPSYRPNENNCDRDAATAGRSSATIADMAVPDSTIEPEDTAMCNVGLPRPASPVNTVPPSPACFEGATPRPAPVGTPLPRFGPDAYESAAAFAIRFGCHPSEFTVTYGVARGLTDEEARYVERAAVAVVLGPQHCWSGGSESSSSVDEDDH